MCVCVGGGGGGGGVGHSVSPTISRDKLYREGSVECPSPTPLSLLVL